MGWNGVSKKNCFSIRAAMQSVSQSVVHVFSYSAGATFVLSWLGCFFLSLARILWFFFWLCGYPVGSGIRNEQLPRIREFGLCGKGASGDPPCDVIPSSGISMSKIHVCMHM